MQAEKKGKETGQKKTRKKVTLLRKKKKKKSAHLLSPFKEKTY
jgi:hypothetical protein